ncbi:MAG: NifB/NifX family molybdenum-iron cluster-binding protein [Bacteroidales bacterium]
MKLAMPTRDGEIDSHFGHCEYYTIFTIENKKVVNRENLPSPMGCGCKSNISSILQDMGVELMLAGNMGEGAKMVLEGHKIQVIRGCSGAIDEVLQEYLQGRISDSGQGCHHEEGEQHQCPNH